jgi:hypothetical protein
LEDILEYWRELFQTKADTPKEFQYVDSYTLHTLRRFSDLDEDQEGKMSTLKTLFTEKGDMRLLKGFPSSKLTSIYMVFMNMWKRGRRLRSFKSLNENVTLTYEPFYRCVEQVAFWIDVDFRKGYQGGSEVRDRPRVEVTLSRYCGKAGYYAVMWYVIRHLRELYTVSNIRLKALMEMKNQGTRWTDYFHQFRYQHWYQLAYVVLHHWGLKPADGLEELPKFMKKVANFRVSIPLQNATDYVETQIRAATSDR